MRFFQADSISGSADSMKKPHHIATLRFREVVNDHPKCLLALSEKCDLGFLITN